MASPPIRHPSGIIVEILGTKAASNGRSCEEHEVCGASLFIDGVVRIQSVQIINEHGQEETALAVYSISDGIDHCHVGFLSRALVKHKKEYDGKIAQVVEFLDKSESPQDRKKSHRCMGIIKAIIIEAERARDTPVKKRKTYQCAQDSSPDSSLGGSIL